MQLVLHSPYVRTVQTAAILRQYSAAPQQASDLLVPDADPRILVDALYQLSQQYQSIALVSHQPLVGTLIDDLGGFECGRYRMGTAALASLSCDPMAALCCTLDWLIHP